MFVQPFWQVTPGCSNLETESVKGCLQVVQSIVSPFPILLIKFRCALNDFVAALLTAEKSSFVILPL